MVPFSRARRRHEFSCRAHYPGLALSPSPGTEQDKPTYKSRHMSAPSQSKKICSPAPRKLAAFGRSSTTLFAHPVSQTAQGDIGGPGEGGGTRLLATSCAWVCPNMDLDPPLWFNLKKSTDPSRVLPPCEGIETPPQPRTCQPAARRPRKWT